MEEDGGAWQPARGRARLKEQNVWMKYLDAERVRQQFRISVVSGSNMPLQGFT